MTDFDRRAVIRAAVAVPLASLVWQRAGAEDLPRLDNSDPMAAALAYIETSGSPDQTCGNCQLYTGEVGKEWGGCAIFPGKLVAVSGWCKSWVIRVG